MIGKKTIISVTVVIFGIWWRNKSPEKLKSPIVEISPGRLQGVISVSRDGRNFYEYLGVPYAQPPINDLRFEPPEPAEKWEGIRDASQYGPKCIQLDLFSSTIEGVEDCLHLNIHSPKLNQDGSLQHLMPVMVWIHGGLFVFGSGVFYRPDYFMDEDVVVVTINYRLGSFGFLNTGDGTIRGNMGLKDQHMALLWIQENIQKFGGDPNSVTIFGESAGGASVHYHMLSPMSKGLFHKAISQSGMSSMPWALYPSPLEQARRFGDKLNCTSPNTKLMIRCIKVRSANEVVSVHLETIDPLHELVSVFVPTLELNIPDGKTFLTESPEKLLGAGNFTKVPFLTGVDSHEGLINAAVIYRNETLTKLISSEWEKWIPRLLYLPDDTDPAILLKLKQFYLGEEINHQPSSLHEFTNITNMFSDRFWNMNFHNGVKSQIKHSTETSPVYLYYYTYNSEFTLTDILLALKGKFSPVIEVLSSMIKRWIAETIFGEKIPRFGVCHGDEIAMQFYIPLPLMPSVPQEHIDYEFSTKIVKLWTTFAKLESSQSNLEFMGTSWPPQRHNETFKYMQLDTIPSLITEPFKQRVEFWNSLVKSWHFK